MCQKQLTSLPTEDSGLWAFHSYYPSKYYLYVILCILFWNSIWIRMASLSSISNYLSYLTTLPLCSRFQLICFIFSCLFTNSSAVINFIFNNFTEFYLSMNLLCFDHFYFIFSFGCFLFFCFNFTFNALR